ncbi:XrtA-associated tyrosine autokinase [Rheinheimera sp. NSM]|uniref:XrtA-associated tyrosine autokinase n=1 Tax=Rheinheimera sp. NSM TaxID=3457884 RepID=UPI0040350C00
MSIIEKAINKQVQQSDTKPLSTIERTQAVTEAGNEPTAGPVAAAVTANIAEPAEHKAFIELNLPELEKKNFVSLSSERRLINEEYRVIKRKLINNAFGALSSTLKHSNLILVTSSRPGEGKTFSAINLALSIALEQDKTVLLVDSDVLRPSVSKSLNIKYDIGLTDYLLSDEIKVSDIMLSTNVERLKIITAGRPHHLSTELLASERMLMLANEFASRYHDRIVIFDAPPLLGVNETAVMASMCGQAVVVLEENRTKIAEIEQAVTLLPKDIATGFLINKAHRNQGKGYGYGYYYGAG